MFTCHDNGGNQEWHYTTEDELRNRDSCLTFTSNASLNSSKVILDGCDGSLSQKWEFIDGVLRKTEYDMCVEARGKDIITAKCNPAFPEQKFKSNLLYEIDRFCTFKQGSYILFDANKVTIATNGFLVYRGNCLNYDSTSSSLSFGQCRNQESQKWNYMTDGQIKNVYKNVCVDTRNGKVAVNECNLISSSQQWICERK